MLLEQAASKRSFGESLATALHALNLAGCVAAPVYAFNLNTRSGPLFGLNLMMSACVVFMKLVSYAHTNACLRARAFSVQVKNT